jgi:hypothetical protein
MRRANHVRLEEENNQCCARRMVERELAQRLERREEPGVREHESAQRAVARDEPSVREYHLLI